MGNHYSDHNLGLEECYTSRPVVRLQAEEIQSWSKRQAGKRIQTLYHSIDAW